MIGIGVTLISTTKESFESVILEWDNDRQVSAYNLDKGLGFPFNEKDTVLVSGLSTSLAALNSTFQVGIKSETVGLAQTMAYTLALLVEHMKTFSYLENSILFLLEVH